jgi:uncharacterized membrane protein YdjX (TVP38/TMEM64 family)
MTPEKTTSAPRSAMARRLPLLFVLVVAAIGAFTLREHLTFDTLRDNREALLHFRDANYALTALAFIGTYVAIVAFSLPGATIATLTGGFLFSVMPGALFNITAATIGAIAIFTAVRWGLGDRLAAKIDASDGRVKRLKQSIAENELSVLFLVRLVPVVPFFVANVVPALVGVRPRNFALTTFLGIMPGGLVYTWVGAGLGEVFARDETPNLGIIFEPFVLGPILALCALATLPIIVKALRRQGASNGVN